MHQESEELAKTLSRPALSALNKLISHEWGGHGTYGPMTAAEVDVIGVILKQETGCDLEVRLRPEPHGVQSWYLVRNDPAVRRLVSQRIAARTNLRGLMAGDRQHFPGVSKADMDALVREQNKEWGGSPYAATDVGADGVYVTVYASVDQYKTALDPEHARKLTAEDVERMLRRMPIGDIIVLRDESRSLIKKVAQRLNAMGVDGKAWSVFAARNECEISCRAADAKPTRRRAASAEPAAEPVQPVPAVQPVPVTAVTASSTPRASAAAQIAALAVGETVALPGFKPAYIRVAACNTGKELGRRYRTTCVNGTPHVTRVEAGEQ